MVSKPDTGLYASKDAGPRSGVDCEIPPKNKTYFIRVWKPLSSRRVLKFLRERRQYLLTVGLIRYSLIHWFKIWLLVNWDRHWWTKSDLFWVTRKSHKLWISHCSVDISRKYWLLQTIKWYQQKELRAIAVNEQFKHLPLISCQSHFPPSILSSPPAEHQRGYLSNNAYDSLMFTEVEQKHVSNHFMGFADIVFTCL